VADFTPDPSYVDLDEEYENSGARVLSTMDHLDLPFVGLRAKTGEVTFHGRRAVMENPELD
jgi:hypothetical protein